jgi:signal transduction histidine kinase
MDSNTRRNLFLIFKEAVNNIARHSGASVVNVSIQKLPDGLTMVIADNGKNGLMVNPGHGQGLDNMIMRADAMNARLDIRRDHSYRIELNIPGFAWQ